AVELDLVQPSLAVRRTVNGGRKLRLDPVRSGRPDGAPEPAGLQRTRRLRLLDQLVDPPAGLHAFRPRGEDVDRRVGGEITLLEEQPVPFLLAFLRLQARQHPAAV